MNAISCSTNVQYEHQAIFFSFCIFFWGGEGGFLNALCDVLLLLLFFLPVVSLFVSVRHVAVA